MTAFAKYIDGVQAGTIPVGSFVRAAVERHVRDVAEGEERGIWFDEAAAERAIKFCSFVRHSKGKWAGKPFELEPWQAFIVGSVFGWKKAGDIRRFRTAYVEVPRKNGKALAVNTPVATPDGWKLHGELKPGDKVFAPDGKPVEVQAVTESYLGDCYRMTFSDGCEIVAHAKHEWRTSRKWFTGRKRGSRKPMPNVDTETIASTLRCGGRGDLVHAVPVCSPLTCDAVDLPIQPYTLGAWLGDGTSARADITSADDEIIEAIRAEGVPIRKANTQTGHGIASLYTMTVRRGDKDSVGCRLRDLNVRNNKHIPLLYLRASVNQRRELLAGLIDTDGHITPRGQCELVLVNHRLFLDSVELIRSLGMKPTTVEDRARLNGVDCGPRYRIQFWPNACELPLRVPRKAKRLLNRKRGRSNTRMITNAVPCGACLVNCIQVEGGMYLAGRSMIATHNSFLAAVIALYCMIADGEGGAEVYIAATKRDQAKIVHEEARRMVRSSPSLKNRVTTLRDNLHITKTNSKCEPLGADSDTMDGLNPSAVIIDELHAHKTRRVWDVLDTATDARMQPILFCITTAGQEKLSVCGEQHDHVERILAGTLEDDSTFGFIACIDDGDDWKDEKCWAKANPNLGVSVFIDGLRNKFTKAKESSPAALHALLRLHLGVWTKGESGLFDMEAWRACGVSENSNSSETVWLAGESDNTGPDPLEGRDCFGGLDLASRFDVAAFVLLFPPLDESERWRVLPTFWVPRENAEKRSRKDRVPYVSWIERGLMRATDGDVIDFEVIRADLNELRNRYNIKSVGFDAWNCTQLATQLAEQDGFEMVEVYQGFRNLSEATKELLKLVQAGKLDHGGNPVLEWMAGNCIADVDPSGAMKPSRKNSREKIDGIAALVMAVGQSIVDPGGSVYDREDRGLLSF